MLRVIFGGDRILCEHAPPGAVERNALAARRRKRHSRKICSHGLFRCEQPLSDEGFSRGRA